MPRSFVIVVNDNGEMKTITEEQIEDAFPNSSYMATIWNAIDVTLDDAYEAQTIAQEDFRSLLGKPEVRKFIERNNALLRYLGGKKDA